jgi:palmitoyl transferase
MSIFNGNWLSASILYGAVGLMPCHAGQVPDTVSGTTSKALFDTALDTGIDIVQNGKWDIYLSGHAHHSRESYSAKRVRKLNENAWGLGVGKTMRNERGNDESLYVLVIRDSNRNPQWSAGYAYQWVYPLGPNGLEVGAGLSAGVIQRKDWFDGVPFPAILPMFSAGTVNLKLMGSYIPRLSTRKGKGDVLFLFAKYTF